MKNHNITITPNENASKRTKNRIKENGSEFFLFKEADFHHSFNTSAIFVWSKKTNWTGWFPLNEISVDDHSDRE